MSKSIGFLHYRKYNSRSYTTLSRGGFTLAYKFDGSGNAIVSTARCSDKDNYCKATGRKLAEDRLTGREVMVLPAKDRNQHRQAS